MRQVQLHEDEALLTDLASHAEAGETVTLLRGDRPVAQIVPFPQTADAVRAKRRAALERLVAIMDKGYDMGLKWNGRDELYDRNYGS